MDKPSAGLITQIVTILMIWILGAIFYFRIDEPEMACPLLMMMVFVSILVFCFPPSLTKK